MSRPLVVTMSSDAIAHLGEVVLRHVALAELEAGPDSVCWPVVRDAALRELQARAGLGDERAAATWAAVLQASYDARFCELVNGLEADAGGEDGG